MAALETNTANCSSGAYQPGPLTASRLGFWTALAAAVIGAVYALVIGVLFALGKMVMPPPQAMQLFGGIVTIVMAPLLVVIMASMHYCVPARKRIWSLTALVFTVLFAAMVSINRFVQLSIVRQGVANGQTSDLSRFMPYDTASVMFALEMLGWGFFLGLAMFAAAACFTSGKLSAWLRGLCVAYGVLGLTSAVGFILNSPISAVGFIAWGPVLDIIAVLLCVFFRRTRRSAARPVITEG